jgi:hypothetical protein
MVALRSAGFFRPKCEISQIGRRLKIAAVSFVDHHRTLYGAIQELQRTGTMKGGKVGQRPHCDEIPTKFCAKVR